MTLEKKLNEKLERLDKLGGILEKWLERYRSAKTFKSRTFTIKNIKEVVTEMQEVAGQAEILAEVIEESETL